MKWVIYLLLVANISFFVWHYQSAEVRERRAQKQALPDGAVQLVLLKELVTAEAQSVTTANQWCFSLGPFANMAMANQAAEALIALGIPTTQRLSKEAKKKGYWVYLPPAKNRKEAKEKINALKTKHKIKDLFIVATGDKKNAVSLGVFSKFELAYRRRNEIQKLGYPAEVEDVKLPKKEYWLDWPRDFEIALPEEKINDLQTVEPDLIRIERNCRL